MDLNSTENSYTYSYIKIILKKKTKKNFPLKAFFTMFTTVQKFGVSKIFLSRKPVLLFIEDQKTLVTLPSTVQCTYLESTG